MAAERETPSPVQQVTRLYEQAEAEAAKASERLVGSGGFVSLLGQLAENSVALTRLGNDALDLVLRNLRLAGRRDVIRLSRQLARTEDKLERVLQEIEALRDALALDGAPGRTPAGSNGAGADAPGSTASASRSASRRSPSRRPTRAPTRRKPSA